MGVLRRRRAQTGGGYAAGQFPIDEAAEAMFPVLFQFLTATTWPEEGGPREPGTILLFMEGMAFKAMLKDKDDPAVCFVTAASLQGLLEALEAGLESGGLDWRKDRMARDGRMPARRS
jgi:hypothetical protein